MPRTAKDDQPGPTGRRHSKTGGDRDQSVSIRTPRRMPSRLGPRKPGQSAPVFTGAGAGALAIGSLAVLARSRSSGFFAQRHCRSLWKLPVKPPVFKRVHAPQAATIVIAIVAHRVRSGKCLVINAHPTKAMLRTGIAKTRNNRPCAPVAMDGWRKRKVAISARIIRTTAPGRSVQDARLKKTHQITNINAPASSPNTLTRPASGNMIGTTKLDSHCNATATTPGHKRSGLRPLDSSGASLTGAMFTLLIP